LSARSARAHGKALIDRRTSSTGPPLFSILSFILLSDKGSFVLDAHALKCSAAVENGPPNHGIGPMSNSASLRRIIEPISPRNQIDGL